MSKIKETFSVFIRISFDVKETFFVCSFLGEKDASVCSRLKILREA